MDYYFSYLWISTLTEHMTQKKVLFTCYFVFIFVDDFGNLLGLHFIFGALLFLKVRFISILVFVYQKAVKVSDLHFF